MKKFLIAILMCAANAFGQSDQILLPQTLNILNATQGVFPEILSKNLPLSTRVDCKDVQGREIKTSTSDYVRYDSNGKRVADIIKVYFAVPVTGKCTIDKEIFPIIIR